MIQGGGLVTGRSAPMLGCRIRVAVFGDYCLCDARCAGVERRGRGRRGARQTATRAVAMIGVPGGPPERTFAGGLWSAAGNAIWPFARLELLDWGIRVRGGVGGLRWLVPAWQARYGELTGAQLIWAPLAGRGVHVQTANAAGSIVFWSRRGTDILDHLQVHGVPASRSVTRLAWGANANHP